MIGYRYYGHNEVDEPSFTQPIMYAKIRSLETPPHRYANSLIKEGVVSDKDLETLRSQINAHFETEYQASL
jgi:2-oxoglutarate dehydrogenase complex dehydrogenase (E1) component-like enzyme